MYKRQVKYIAEDASWFYEVGNKIVPELGASAFFGWQTLAYNNKFSNASNMGTVINSAGSGGSVGLISPNLFLHCQRLAGNISIYRNSQIVSTNPVAFAGLPGGSVSLLARGAGNIPMQNGSVTCLGLGSAMDGLESSIYQAWGEYKSDLLNIVIG